MSTPDLSRRHAIAAAAAVGLGAPVLAACSSDSTDSTGSPDPTGSTGSAGSDSTGTALVATADVPVGGGAVVDKIVVTQPTEGEFKAFTAVCTHQGCTVTEIADNVITCPCHQSTFSAEDGSNLTGPAPERTPNSLQPLAAFAIKVEGDQILPA